MGHTEERRQCGQS